MLPLDRRGSALVLVVIGLVVLLGVSAVAVDAGMLFATRSEAQRASDAAALAGASAFVDGPGDAVATARARALDYAALNPVRDRAPTGPEVRVTVNAEQALVRVEVVRPAVDTWFARILGVDALTVGARSAARAVAARSATCVRPFSPADPLLLPEAPAGGGNGRGNEGGSGAGGSSPGRRDFAPGDQLPIWGTGDDAEALTWEMPTELGWSGTCSAPGLSGVGSGPEIRRNICMCNNTPIEAGTRYGTVNGNSNGNFRHGIDGLIEQDPGARWDAGRNAVVGSRYADWRQSPRVVALPLHDPAAMAQGRLEFTRFVLIFVEDGGNGTTGRFVRPMTSLQLVE